MKYVGFAACILCALVLASTPVMSQMTKGANYLGARTGIRAREHAFAYRLDFDHCWLKAREFGPGQVVLGGSIDASFPSSDRTTSVSGTKVGYSQKTTFVPISAHASYHFGPMMDDKRIDPFFLVGLAYRYIVVSNEYPSQYAALNASIDYSDLALVGAAGVRYTLNDMWTAHARIGFGFTFISAGMSMKL
ncbi:MAG: outer membrane protein [Candidatus Kapaibacterium sp.]